MHLSKCFKYKKKVVPITSANTWTAEVGKPYICEMKLSNFSDRYAVAGLKDNVINVRYLPRQLS